MKKSPIRLPLIEQEKRKKYYDSIYLKYKDSSLEELKEAFNGIKMSSTAKAAIAHLTQELMMKEKGINNELKELDNE